MKPRIVAIAAMTIDGKIARTAEHFTDWTSPEDKTFLRSFLNQSDVIVIGNTTYKTAIEPLSKRKCIVLTRSVQGAEQHSANLYYFNPAEPSSIKALLKAYGVVVVLGGAQTYTYFLEHGLIDDLYLTIEPVVFGTGINLFECKAGLTANFRLDTVRSLNPTGTVLLHYKRPS